MENDQEKPLKTCPFEKRFPSQLNRDALFYIQLAYNQAIDAWKEDEVPIGAIITHRGEVIAAAHNCVESTKDPTAHAEMLAITQAAQKLGDWRLNECRLYVTKEPCPMCAGASVMARLQEVVYAVSDPKMGFLGSAGKIHEVATLNHKLQARLLEDAPCKEILSAYFKGKRTP